MQCISSKQDLRSTIQGFRKADRTIGFDQFKNYILGKEDGQPKTPEWAEAITGVPADVIARLAGEFATNRPAVAILPTEPGAMTSGNSLHSAMAIHALNALVGSIDVAAEVAANSTITTVLGGVNSVYVENGVLAVAIEADAGDERGAAVFFQTSDQSFLAAYEVGFLPDSIALSPDGNWLSFV